MRRDWSLRLARPGDEAIIADLASGRDAASAARLIRKGHCLTAHVAEPMAGFLVNEPFSRELHIWELLVTPAHRMRGIGSGLVRACLIDARNTGFRAVTLTTDRALAGFFVRLGFDEVTALDAHPRLAGELANEVDDGLPAEHRCAMICFLD
ncbi:MAG: GNAT family N-acetyltransferase [Porphyrobacter sp.]|jgi:ribosomal protein S18 acetylase RimI-like enzyme|nr:GNAT family N-acetyltransferase [Porphyrobacter sp.]